ncbi:hypothetical protein SORDD21_00507 [Streptococcus oralis]|uniref:Uncharacterized protein n=1 Tax=Streptococcus oralis TaxID=1303 RepID=A0A139PPF8_STROR|nr:hypothetical protein [Streptococcus oralis]KXT92126.1 hypothetical protein SORDD21_00507 [Streptococcus oralis]RXX23187.1 hypothetical protein DF216_00095 [Streptococcus oralis]
MSNSGIKKSHKRLLIVLSIAIITAVGIFMFSMLEKSQEECRNREYEVSLVNSLKNSYEGIEEIEISNPTYTNPPGDWSCKVDILFEDGKKIFYGILHNLDEIENYNGRMTYGQRDFLNRRKGITTNTVTVTYSNKERGEQ